MCVKGHTLKCTEAGWSGLIRSDDTAEPTAIKAPIGPTLNINMKMCTLADIDSLVIITKV